MAKRMTAIVRSFRLGVWVCVAVLVLATSQSWALNVHSIRIGAYGTAAEAEAARAKAAETCSPAFVREDASLGATPYPVLVGHFPYYAEAWVCMKKLQDQGICKDPAVVTWEWDGRDLEQSKLPIALPFNTEGLENAPLFDPDAMWGVVGAGYSGVLDPLLLSKPQGELSEDELLTVGLGAPTNSQGIPALDQFLAAYGKDPRANGARLRLVRRLQGASRWDEARAMTDQVLQSGTADEKAFARLLAAYTEYYQGNLDAAYAAFRGVASDTANPTCVRLDAMRRAAGTAHKVLKWQDAYLAFLQLERVAPDAATASEARLQLTGLAFELRVHNNVGGWEEVRKIGWSVDDIQGAPDQQRATAHLMLAETYYQDGNYARAIEEADKLVAEFPQLARERASALFWKGKSLLKQHRDSEALAVFEQVAADPIQEKDMFAGVNVKARALLEGIGICRRQGQVEQARMLESSLLSLYPDTPEAKQLTAAP